VPTWGELLKELNDLQADAESNPPKYRDVSPFDVLRRKYLRALSGITGRATIVYATAWMENKPLSNAEDLSINLGDMQGFMEAVSNVKEKQLDLILHSPGGSAEAADSMVGYLRTRFDHIRAIVPIAAMSAATMIALATDEIVMGTHSQLDRSTHSSPSSRPRVRAPHRRRRSRTSSIWRRRSAVTRRTSGPGYRSSGRTCRGC
jgi:ClpP class serine protease